MADYIAREAVLKHKRKMSGVDWSGEFWDEAVLCEDIIKIPAADVEPVVRGKWIKYTIDNCYGSCDWDFWYKCSNCNHVALGWVSEDIWYSFPILSKCCPHCGVKMSKEN